MRIIGNCKLSQAAQWLSGRVVDSRVSGCGSLEPNQRHCVVSLSKTPYSMLNTGSTQEDPFLHKRKNVDWNVKNNNKQSITLNTFTAKRDCSRIYLSLPNTTKVII